MDWEPIKGFVPQYFMGVAVFVWMRDIRFDAAYPDMGRVIKNPAQYELAIGNEPPRFVKSKNGVWTDGYRVITHYIEIQEPADA